MDNNLWKQPNVMGAFRDYGQLKISALYAVYKRIKRDNKGSINWDALKKTEVQIHDANPTEKGGITRTSDGRYVVRKEFLVVIKGLDIESVYNKKGGR